METLENSVKEEIVGLTSSEVEAARAAGNVNRTKEKAGKSYAKIIFDNLFTFFNLVWALVALVLIAVGSYANLTFLFIIVPNTLIAIIQEMRAKRTVAKLAVSTDPLAIVLRDGEFVSIPAGDIVLGDVMRIELGKQVLSDAEVISGLAEANESLLTGESDAIKKQAGDIVLAGSYIVSGSVLVKVIRVGAQNYVHKIEHAARGFKKPVSNLFRDLNNLIKYIGIFLVPMTAITALSNWFAYNGNKVEVIEQTSGSVIGMIPAGIYLLVTITLTLSVILLAKKKTLVKDMYSIEMLASADVICLDKTGTITDGTMYVSDVVSIDGSSDESISALISALVGAEDSINNTSAALMDKFGKRECDIVDKIPFSSSRKYSAASIGGVGSFAIGAPHFVPAGINPVVEKMISGFAKEGKRVLILSSLSELEAKEGKAIALIAITDRIRPNAKEIINNFQRQGVSVKVISGDHAATVSTIAQRVGVIGAENYLSCENISDEELYATAEKYSVFGRVTPEQKVLLVKALKDNGHTVAMTGDGVNDTLALKESNCAIAMADGSEVARAVSQIVLMNSDFGTLPDVVKEGRRCINNVRQSASLFLMKTVFTILLSIFAAATVTGYPIEPGQMMMLEMFVIGIPSVLLALEPNHKRIEGAFLKKVLISSIPNALIMFIPVLAILLLGLSDVGISADSRNAIAVITVTLVGLTNLIALCRPFTKWRVGVCAIAAVGVAVLTFGSILLGDIYKLSFAADNLPFFIGTLGASLSFAVLMHLVFGHIQGGVRKLFDKIFRTSKKAKN